MQLTESHLNIFWRSLIALLLLSLCLGAEADRRIYLVELAKGHAQSPQGVLERILGRAVEPVHLYRHAINGASVPLDADEAVALAAVPGVVRVLADVELPAERFESATRSRALVVGADAQHADPMPDPVADLIGATTVWDGSGTGLPASLGEGVIIGVVGTGINGGHPSFSALGGDGYQHFNPLGPGVYLGECLDTPELVCNEKLIGRWTFVNPDGTTSEDEDGYGSFVAGLAAGNRLFGVALTSAIGQASGVTLDEISGVAPHANIVAYRVCAPTCFASDVIRAIDQSIDDGVDVLVYTIGASNNSPWNDAISLSMFAARAAGISVTVGSGRTGPAYGTTASAAAAPWTATFTASTHGRDFSIKELRDFAGGSATLDAIISGAGYSAGITAPIVDAALYPNPNDLNGDPAQCLQPYPAGTFNGQIVLCDRGAIPRILKGLHVAQGGAGGLVLANTSDGFQFLSADVSALPMINIAASDGEALHEWLAGGTGHMATMTPALPVIDTELADLLGSFNSRGPNLGLDYLVPSVSAPGQRVIAAGSGADEFILSDARGSHPGAGAIALLKALHPDWSAAEILSALMTTGFTGMLEQGTLLPSDPYGYGGGRIDVAAAARAALLLDVGQKEFFAAAPYRDGRPRDLNLPGLVDNHCMTSCSWLRTLRATRAGTWQTSAVGRDGDLVVRVAPAEFTLAAGERQTIDVDLDGFDADTGGIRFAEVILESLTDNTAPPTVLQVAVDLLLDSDGDGVANRDDNCIHVDNPTQRDSNGDGYGNACDGDLNNDGIVNSTDLGLLRAAFDSTDDDADLDGSGTVDAGDVELLRGMFYAAPGPSGVAQEL